MRILNTRSLVETVDRVNEAFFFGDKLPIAERKATARWIASRRGGPGAYWGLFAPTKKDLDRGVKVFTGERYDHAAARHILGEESCRALLLLDVDEPEVQEALDVARTGILHRVKLYADKSGMFCCGPCTVSVWRHALGAGDRESTSLVTKGMKALRAHRKDDGTWRRFPFYYTLLALEEMDSTTAKAEIKHASEVCERYVSGPERSSKTSRRRKAVAERALQRL